METFENHIESMRDVFRRLHADVQDVAVAESESFEEHNEQMEIIVSRSHAMLDTEATKFNKHGMPEDMMIPEVPQIDKESGGSRSNMSRTARLHIVPGCMLPRHRFPLNQSRLQS